jgi:hypothetical protein
VPLIKGYLAPTLGALSEVIKMKPIKIYVSEFKGVNCREYLPSAHLSYDDAQKEDCDITVLNGLIPDDWGVAVSDWGGLCLYDKAGEYLPLSVNINHNSSIILDRVSSVSVIKNNSHTVIARKNNYEDDKQAEERGV